MPARLLLRSRLALSETAFVEIVVWQVPQPVRGSGHDYKYRTALVAAGECVLVSPEGTRSWDGRLLPMKRGAFMLAMESRKPIVCMTVIGAHERMPRGSAVVRPGPIRVVFSDPIAVGQADPEDTSTRTELMARVASTFEAAKAAHALG